MKIIEEYSMLVFVFSVIVAIMSLPVGLLVPVYFHIKADNGEAGEQTPLEIFAVLFSGVIGILGVELGGRTGAIIAIILPIIVVIGMLTVLFGFAAL
jgi:amino acid transporter